MCGITGIIQPSSQGPIDEGIVRAMAGSLAHRGPDDKGFYFDRNAALAHRRLSIIDIASGHQPMSNEDGTIWIVFNGQIYNYLEIRQGLTGKGHRFSTHSDTEVILHLYEEYGEACLDKLNGMFAFLIWDTRKERAFLARDRLGIKPLYYVFDGGRLICASEIKALLHHPDIPARPNWEGIWDYFAFQFCLGEKTLFRGIKNSFLVTLFCSNPRNRVVFP